ncbi:MAG: hypothetical protein Q9208_002122 [Pyrenodesmia sp. 3 TL-2023]
MQSFTAMRDELPFAETTAAGPSLGAKRPLEARLAEDVALRGDPTTYANATKGKALEGNAERRAFRKVSKDDGVRSPKGDDSEYYFYNVVYGESHVEENGTSLLNYANADAICGLIDQFLAQGIPSESIVVLTMYKARLKLRY